MWTLPQLREVLQREGAYVDLCDEWGCPVLVQSSRAGQVQIVRYLLEHYPLVAIPLIELPLYHAVLHNRRACAAFLIQAGCDVNERDHWQRTALHAAALHGHQDLLCWLLDSHYADIHAQCSVGKTALHRAAGGGFEFLCVTLAIRSPLLVNMTDKQRERTALHIASERGFESIVQCLCVQFAADCQLVDNTGRTAAQVASRFGHYAIARWLEVHSTSVPSPT